MEGSEPSPNQREPTLEGTDLVAHGLDPHLRMLRTFSGEALCGF